MKDKGEASFILGVKIVRDCLKELPSLSLKTYIKKVFKQFKMQNAKPFDTL